MSLTIRNILFLVSFGFMAFIVMITITVNLLLQGQQRNSEIEYRKYESFNLAVELKQSSDDLTRFARTYAVTGKPEYEHYFQTIIAIRDGKQAHPDSYTHSYWDHVAAGIVKLNQDGELYSIEQRMIDLGLSEEEITRLSDAKRESDDLINLEDIAMNAVKGLYKDEKGLFTIEGKPDLAMAVKLLHGKEYHDAKTKIMKPIDQFFKLIDSRYATELGAIQERNEVIVLILILLIVVAIGFFVYTLQLFRKRIISPLATLESDANAIGLGDYSRRTNIVSVDEVGTVANAFNIMVESIEHHVIRLRSIIDTAVDGIIVIDSAGIVREFSPSAERIFGYKKEEAIGNNIKMLIPEPDRSKHDRYIADYLKSRKSKVLGTIREVTGLRKNREIFNMDLAVAEMIIDNEMFFTGSVRDISDRKAAEKTRLENKKIETEARIKSEFLTNMSHEIRTPLNAVLGMARIGLRESGEDTSQEKFTHIIDSGQHLLGVINDILDFSKIEAGKLVIDSHPFQLIAAVESMIELIAEQAKVKNLQLRVNFDSNLPGWVEGDTLRLQQILLNLLTNAVKFTCYGEVLITVTREGEVTHFRVCDSGIGMSKEEISRLFASFEQADSSITRKYGGSGLGLTISQNLAKLMGGEIRVESQSCTGSVFTLTLPLPAAQPPAKKDSVTPSMTVKQLKGLKILAAEDVELNRIILEDLLVEEGAHVVFAENGQQALERLEEMDVDYFDIVLMDIQMPVMGGHEASRQIHAMSPGLPIIGLTAHVLKEEREKCLAAGMLEHVTKPIDPDKLIAAIRCHVDSASNPPDKTLSDEQ